MTQKYQDWLAAQIINEGNIISYRSLSRALKVHSNAAKEMLYDFHRTQNARKPGSLHATYLLAGTRKPEAQPLSNGHTSTSQPDEDVPMSDIPFLNSSMPDQDGQAEETSIPVTTITLVKEEELEDVKKSYEMLESIHVYSLEPSTLKNIQILSDCNRKITTEYASDDLLHTWKTYGTIYNPLAKRRTGARPPPPPADPKPAPAAAITPAAPKPTPAKAPTPDPTTTTTTAKPALSRTSSIKSDSTTTTTKKATTSKPPALKKESSSIFKAFAAKPKSAPSAISRTTSASEASAAASPAAESPVVDEPMPDAPSSDDEAEAEFTGNALDGDAAKTAAAANRAAKDEREANLRKMMDADDQDEDDEPATAAIPIEPTEDATVIEPEPEPAPTTTISNGRRRGRRRVMKKKTTKDAEGYLVTKEEMGWESFSESDKEAGVAAAKKSTAGVAAKAAGGGGGVGAGAKAKAGSTAKKGQGNIMSFFGKK